MVYRKVGRVAGSRWWVGGWGQGGGRLRLECGSRIGGGGGVPGSSGGLTAAGMEWVKRRAGQCWARRGKLVGAATGRWQDPRVR